MKKTIFKILVTLSFLLFASHAFAEDFSDGGSIAIGNENFTCSTKVNISVAATSTSYLAYSYHDSGNNEYGTTEDDGVLKQKKPGSASSATDGAGTLADTFK